LNLQTIKVTPFPDLTSTPSLTLIDTIMNSKYDIEVFHLTQQVKKSEYAPELDVDDYRSIYSTYVNVAFFLKNPPK